MNYAVCLCVCVHACTLIPSFSHVWLFATTWTVACTLSIRFFRQKYWSGLPFPPPGDLPDPGIEPVSVFMLSLLFLRDTAPDPPGVLNSIWYI